MRIFSPFNPPVFQDEEVNWIDVTSLGSQDPEYVPGVRDLGDMGFRWLKASRDFIQGNIECEEYERQLDELLGISA